MISSRKILSYSTDALPYIRNRWITKHHHVIIHHKDVQKGHYYDTDHIMLHANFQLLQDFVEIECSHRDDHFLTGWQRIYRLFELTPILSYFLPASRNSLEGLHYLRFCMKLKDMDSQRDHAKEVFRLYKWWVKERPLRTDPMSFYDEYCKTHGERKWSNPISKKERKVFRDIHKLEERYHKEDEHNLIALMKIRRGLWT